MRASRPLNTFLTEREREREREKERNDKSQKKDTTEKKKITSPHIINEATERVKLDKSIGNKLVLVLCPVTEMAGHWMRHEDLSMSNLVLDEPLNRTRALPKQTGLGT